MTSYILEDLRRAVGKVQDDLYLLKNEVLDMKRMLDELADIVRDIAPDYFPTESKEVEQQPNAQPNQPNVPVQSPRQTQIRHWYPHIVDPNDYADQYDY